MRILAQILILSLLCGCSPLVKIEDINFTLWKKVVFIKPSGNKLHVIRYSYIRPTIKTGDWVVENLDIDNIITDEFSSSLMEANWEVEVVSRNELVREFNDLHKTPFNTLNELLRLREFLSSLRDKGYDGLVLLSYYPGYKDRAFNIVYLQNPFPLLTWSYYYLQQVKLVVYNLHSPSRPPLDIRFFIKKKTSHKWKSNWYDYSPEEQMKIRTLGEKLIRENLRENLKEFFNSIKLSSKNISIGK